LSDLPLSPLPPRIVSPPRFRTPPCSSSTWNSSITHLVAAHLRCATHDLCSFRYHPILSSAFHVHCELRGPPSPGCPAVAQVLVPDLLNYQLRHVSQFSDSSPLLITVFRARCNTYNPVSAFLILVGFSPVPPGSFKSFAMMRLSPQ